MPLGQTHQKDKGKQNREKGQSQQLVHREHDSGKCSSEKREQQV